MDVITEKWDTILEHVREEHALSDVSYKTWIKPLRIHKTDNNTVNILVPGGSVALDIVNRKFSLPIKVAIEEITGLACEVQFILPEEAENPSKTPAAPSASAVAGLNPRYTFDSFVVGSNNKFAHAASLAVAESPGDV